MAVPASAAAPSRQSVPIRTTFPAPVLSQACGFAITGGLNGTMTVKDFVDREGNFSQEITQIHMVQTFSANGHLVSGHTSQPIKTLVQPDGSITVTFMGNDSMFTLPGPGPAIGSVGRLVLLFSADGDLVDVVQETGQVFQDPSAICAALAP